MRDQPAPIIEKVRPRSLAARAGIRPGDRLVRVNQQRIADEFDLRFAQAEDRAEVEWIDRGGALRRAAMDKEPDRDLGLTLAETAFRSCRVRCQFCFIDQNPKGLRKPLYFKDEDYRFSWLYGNYVTLFNMDEADFAKAIERRMSPMFVSVHATDEALRSRVLGVKKPTHIMDRLRRLAAAGMELHTQVVVAPGLNDGAALVRTLRDLAGLHPAVASIAVVPVGLTRHRGGLAELRLQTPAEAAEVLDLVEGLQARWLRELGTRLVFAADEWYLRAGRPLPALATYEDSPQLGNGVGQVRGFVDDFGRRLKAVRPAARRRRVLAATGRAFAPFLEAAARRLERKAPGLRVAVAAVDNALFGPTVTVAGLLCGADLEAGLRAALAAHPADRILVPDVMLKEGEGKFLDDRTPALLQKALGVPVKVVGADAEGFIKGCIQ